MRWLALHPPLLSLEAFCAGLPAQSPSSAGLPLQQAGEQRPVALLAEHHVCAVNSAATALGVQPGQRRATALALAPELQLGQADAARDTQALQALAYAALAFTPAVTLARADEPGPAVLLEVSSCLRYFGGPARLLQRLREALAPLGHRMQIASAPTPLAAALLACWRDDLAEGTHTDDRGALLKLLGTAPLALLAPAQHEAMQGMGLQRLADLRALPRSGLARRFGAGLLDALDRAEGRRPDPRRWIEAPARFDARLELPLRADSSEQVLHGAQVLLQRLVAWARAQQARVGAFTLVMQHEVRHRGDDTPAATSLHVELAAASADPAHLQLLLRERLARCQLPAPTLELRLHCHHISHRAPPNGELFPTRHSEHEGLLRLLERLRARLGEAQVQQLQAHADHRPEQAAQCTALAGALPPAPPPPAASTLPLHRPLWLLPHAQALAERHEQPLWQGRPLQLLAGPERIESGWWDGPPVARDYFIAQAGDGALLWLYRARLPGDERQAQWFLHGHYA